MLNRDARYVAAAVQGIIAWEWLVSGANKVFSGTFPQGLAGTLDESVKGNPNGWYVSFLQEIVIPHSVAFGYAIEMTEVLIGIALLMGVVLLLSPLHQRGTPQFRLAVGEMVAAVLASLACAFLCINFHFFMGNGLFPGLNTAAPFDEGVSLDTLMPPLSLLILIVNVLVLGDMLGISVVQRLSNVINHARHSLRGEQAITPETADQASSTW